MKKTVSLIAAGALALTLSACGGGEEANVAPPETNVEEIVPMNDMGNMAMPEAPVSNDVAPVPAPKGKDFDETVTQDDADATGMTSRVDRGGDNDSAPAQ